MKFMARIFLLLLVIAGSVGLYGSVCRSSDGARACGESCTTSGGNCSCTGTCTENEYKLVLQ